jgi:hypothetical protein
MDISAGPEWCSSEFRSALASFLNQQVTQYSAARKVCGYNQRGAGGSGKEGHCENYWYD